MMLVALVGFSGCSKFLDINENPNNPDSAAPSLLLPTVEAAISQVVGNQFQVYGGIWGQYWAQNVASSQYQTLEQYNVNTSAFNNTWSILYRNALNNAQLIINDEQTASAEHYKAIAYILKAYAAQLATDAFGNVPLSEALNAAEYDNPRYDEQQVVYDSIFTYLDLGIALAQTPNAINPGTQDMLMGGDMGKWIAFANTLKLRAYLRLSSVSPEQAQSGIAALYGTDPVFLGEDVSIEYLTVGGNENPLYNEMVGLGYVQNLVASATAVRAFNRNDDPRVLRFYDPLAGSDTITYLPQGAYNNPDYTGRSYSPPSSLVGARANDPVSATAPVKLISEAESYFLQAEAIHRGWGSGDAKELFRAGIVASFLATGLSEADAEAYFSSAPDAEDLFDEDPFKAIITQKYYAMNGFQGFEAWTEWRRTGYPDFFVVSQASTLGADRMPLRFPYPNSEITSNDNFPGTELLYTPVWWDVQ